MIIKITKFAIICLLIIFGITTCNSYADSIWSSGLSSPYSSELTYKEGDIIMVLILETTSAVQKAGTDTQNQDNLSINFAHNIEKIYSALGPNNSLQGTGGNTYKGAASTSRSNNVLAAVAATITKVLPNGNFKIYGTHKVSVNEETQEIVIEGAVRPKDVTNWNTVYSYQVADAQVTVQGRGAIQEAAAPGLLFRLFNLLF